MEVDEVGERSDGMGVLTFMVSGRRTPHRWQAFSRGSMR
jgi:hypothetical protein